MSRKHKSNRRRKITQSNVPAPIDYKKSVETAQETNAQPENISENATETALPDSTENPVANTLPTETENTVAGSLNAASENDSPYSLDAHYAAQEQNNTECEVLATEAVAAAEPTQDSSLKTENSPENNEPSPAVASTNAAPQPTQPTTTESPAVEAVSLVEYEQLKNKNRRRLVSAGALVLVAGSLFAAASKDNAQHANDPALTMIKVASQPTEQPEILRPAGSDRLADLSMDDTPSRPIPLKNNAIATPQDRIANPTPRVAPPTKTKTVSTTNVAKPNFTPPPQPVTENIKSREIPKPRENTKTREEMRLAEERRQRAQIKAAEAEARRLATEREVASKARAAQANADRMRNNERAQLTIERAAQEKQRAQRQAAERANKTAAANNSGSGNKAIQAGAFADKEAAKRMQQQLRSLNYNARLEEVQTNKGRVYRVRTGNFANDSDAQSALNQIRNKGVNAMVVGK